MMLGHLLENRSMFITIIIHACINVELSQLLEVMLTKFFRFFLSTGLVQCTFKCI